MTSVMQALTGNSLTLIYDGTPAYAYSAVSRLEATFDGKTLILIERQFSRSPSNRIDLPELMFEISADEISRFIKGHGIRI